MNIPDRRESQRDRELDEGTVEPPPAKEAEAAERTDRSKEAQSGQKRGSLSDTVDDGRSRAGPGRLVGVSAFATPEEDGDETSKQLGSAPAQVEATDGGRSEKQRAVVAPGSHLSSDALGKGASRKAALTAEGKKTSGGVSQVPEPDSKEHARAKGKDLEHRPVGLKKQLRTDTSSKVLPTKGTPGGLRAPGERKKGNAGGRARPKSHHKASSAVDPPDLAGGAAAKAEVPATNEPAEAAKSALNVNVEAAQGWAEGAAQDRLESRRLRKAGPEGSQ